MTQDYIKNQSLHNYHKKKPFPDFWGWRASETNKKNKEKYTKCGRKAAPLGEGGRRVPHVATKFGYALSVKEFSKGGFPGQCFQSIVFPIYFSKKKLILTWSGNRFAEDETTNTLEMCISISWKVHDSIFWVVATTWIETKKK